MCSGLILIGRGLDLRWFLKDALNWKIVDLLFGFERTFSQLWKSGDDSEVETPVPMPNTEVKHFRGEDSWACPCENSSLPVFLCLQSDIEKTEAIWGSIAKSGSFFDEFWLSYTHLLIAKLPQLLTEQGILLYILFRDIVRFVTQGFIWGLSLRK